MSLTGTRSKFIFHRGHLLHPYSALPTFIKSEINAEDVIHGSEKTKEIWHEILETKEKLNECVEGLDKNLNKVLQKHEYEYMAAYNI